MAARVASFNPLAIFAEATTRRPGTVTASDSIYGAEVDARWRSRSSDFPPYGAAYDETAELAVTEVEQTCARRRPSLPRARWRSPRSPMSTRPLQDRQLQPNALAALAVAITPENVSLIEKSDEAVEDFGIEDKLLPVAEGASLRKMLLAEGASDADADAIRSALVADFSFDFREGSRCASGLRRTALPGRSAVRVSLYEGDDHVATVALSDTGTYVAAAPPATTIRASSSPRRRRRRSRRARSPTSMRAWGTGMSLDMPEELIEKLVHMFSSDVDYRSRLRQATGWR